MLHLCPNIDSYTQKKVKVPKFQVSSGHSSTFKMFGMKPTEDTLDGRVVKVGIIGSVGMINTSHSERMLTCFFSGVA